MTSVYVALIVSVSSVADVCERSIWNPRPPRYSRCNDFSTRVSSALILSGVENEADIPSCENDARPDVADVNAVSSASRRASSIAICSAMVLFAMPPFQSMARVLSIGV